MIENGMKGSFHWVEAERHGLISPWIFCLVSAPTSPSWKLPPSTSFDGRKRLLLWWREGGRGSRHEDTSARWLSLHRTILWAVRGGAGGSPACLTCDLILIIIDLALGSQAISFSRGCIQGTKPSHEPTLKLLLWLNGLPECRKWLLLRMFWRSLEGWI